MASTIFISYSRHDQREAFGLRDLLRNEGFTVWIDQEAIEAATQWSAEIVDNIKLCDIFIILLSHTSALSHNVTKELSLASENRKIVFPIELEAVQLPSTLEYALAGVQKVHYRDKEAILRGIHRHITDHSLSEVSNSPKRPFFSRYKIVLASAIVLGIVLSIFLLKNSGKTEAKSDKRVAIAVLSFAVYNSDQDSIATLDVFSEGIVTQLSSHPDFLMTSRAKAKEFDNSELRAVAIGKNLGVRFIIDGTVRKSADRLKVCARLYDVNAGVDVWSKEYSGSIRQLLSIRDTLGSDIIASAMLVISEERALAEAEKRAKDHPTDAEAYRLLSLQYQFSNKVKSVEMMEKAAKLNPTESYYCMFLAQTYAMLNNPAKSKEFAERGKPLYEKAIAEKPLELFLRIQYASLFFYSGEPERAIGYLRDVIAHSIRTKSNEMWISECYYSIACMLSQQNKIEVSLDNLDSCMHHNTIAGRESFIESDPDLDNVRNLPRFRRIVYGR